MGVVGSSWPTHRRRRLSLYERSIQNRFVEIVNTVKLLSTVETRAMREALLEHNRTHEGLRGTASIRPEDIDQARLSGRFWAFILPGGRISVHIDALYDVTRLLDWFEPQIGSILTRTPEGWRATDPCEEGARLKYLPDAPIPGCCANARIWPQGT